MLVDVRIDGEKVRAAREQRFLSQRELADRAELNHNTVWRIETSGLTDVHPRTIRKIAEALSVDPTSLTPKDTPARLPTFTRCNDDTARECTRFPPRRPPTRLRARGSASRRSTSKLLARALERRSGPLRCRRDPRQVGARGVLRRRDRRLAI